MRFSPPLRWFSWALGLLLLASACSDVRFQSTLPPAEAHPTQADAAMSTALRAAYVDAVQRGAGEGYRAEPAGSGFRMHSPAQGFRTELRAHGVDVASEQVGGAAWSWDATPARWGCDGDLSEDLERVEPEAQGNRVDYRRAGLSEWYLNGPLGLEQGFTLAAPPACRGRGGKGVVIALRGGRGLEGSIVDEGKTAVLRDGGGRAVLRYGDMYVVDATGKELAAALQVGPSGLAIWFEDRDAAYPVTVDPLIWVQQGELLASDGAVNNQFGSSVAISGDTAVVGAYNRASQQGAAYVFVRSGTTWSQQQELTAADGVALDGFGWSVAVSGNTAIIGAPFKVSQQGAAYVFVRSGTSWSQQQTLTAADGAISDEFGTSVSISEDGQTVVVGAPDKTSSKGAAYVFLLFSSPSTWLQYQELSASDGVVGDRFGTSVAVSANIAVVGATGNAMYRGAAYAFAFSNSSWSQQQELTAADGVPGDLFGWSVAVSGSTAVVGASAKGAAYVFVLVSSSWSQQQKLIASDGMPNDEFGYSVAVSMDTAVVGASAKELRQGAAYVFVRSSSSWSQQQELIAADGAADDAFGGSVAVSANIAVVGAPNKLSQQGAAYVFVQPSSTGFACTSATECASGFCVNYVCCAAASCPVSSTCHIGICQAATGVCGNQPVADGTLCDDGNPCTQTDICHGGVCTGGNPVTCTASNSCHTASCNPGTGLCSSAVADGGSCDDGNRCTQTDTCQGGVCKGQNPVVCSAPDACHDAYCNPTSGQCAAQPKPDGAPCNDGIACTQPDTCQKGVCVGGGICSPLDACHLPGTCDSTTGCHNPRSPDGTPCDDGNTCTQHDACQSGVCTGTSTACPWIDACHPGVCDPATGLCSNPYSPACGDAGSSVPPGTATCAADADCPGGFCVDQVCCNAKCAEACSSCALPGHIGQCTLEPTGVDLRHDCGVGAGCLATCGPGGTCVGADKETQCEPSRCTDANHGLSAAFCAAPDAACPIGASVPFDCGSYRCEPVFGACFTVCRSVADCAPGSVCDPSGACGPPPSVANELGAGCSVATPGPSPGQAWWAVLGVVVAATATARRGARLRRFPWMLLSLVLFAGSCRDAGSPPTDPARPIQTREAVSRALRAAYVSAVQNGAGRAYRAEPTASGFRTESPAQGLRAELRAQGVEVAPAQAGGAAWSWDAAPARWGCDEDLSAELPRVEPEAQGNRVDYRREGLSEWYLNGPLGLEQGFTLAAPPVCSGRGGQGVVIALLGGGGLEASIEEEGKTAVLRDSAGRAVLRYADLYVVDAVGRQLPAAFQVGPSGLAIRFEDRGAAYPVTVDPLIWVQQAELLASDGEAMDFFGASVAVSGDTAVVGALMGLPGQASQQGVAYVFVRTGSFWSQQQKLTASDGAMNDEFGSVAVSGDTAVVGAYGAASQQGAAYVFVRTGSSWSQQQKLTATDGMPNDHFGASVAISADTLIVGAYEMGSYQGAAYVFVRSGASWSQQQEFIGAANDNFGTSVAVSGDTALVGVPGKASGQGAAYVFVRSGTSWSQPQELIASGGAANDNFGISVAISGDTALVGVPGKASYQGAAYVFVRSGASWSQQQELIAADSAANEFGESVAVSGDTAVVGATLNASMQQGTAYVFVRSGASWSQQQELTAADSAVSDYFGGTVAVGGDIAVVGAPGKASFQGAAYAFVIGSGLGDTCTTAAQCASSFCVDDVCCSVPSCPASDLCHIPAACTSGTGLCSAAAKADGTTCDDGNPCTQLGACQGGVCNGQNPVVCSAPDACHDAYCDPTSGQCVTQARADGAACNSGYACAKPGVCQGGSCLGATPIPCTPSDACHDAVCQPAMGTCSITAKADDTTCDDGNPCTHPDTCQGGSCTGTIAPNNTPCDDGDRCTTMDTCLAGVCTGSAPVACAPLDACHDPGTCDPTTGTCSNPLKPLCDPSLDGGSQGGAVPASGVQTCATGAECPTGQCAGGVCCDTACTDTCSSCVLPGHLGHCTPEPTGVDLNHDCGAEGSCLGTCGPGGACVGAGNGTQCVASHCTDASHGVGPAYCPSEGTVCAVSTAVPFDCGSYRCASVLGACYASCQSVAECAPGWTCDPSGQCVPPPDVAAGHDVSCGLAAAGTRDDARGWAAGLLLVAAALQRRRRARPGVASPC